MPYGALPPISSLFSPIARSVFDRECRFIPLGDDVRWQRSALVNLMTSWATGTPILLSQVSSQRQKPVFELRHPFVATR